MTRRTNASIAGVTFLAYIAFGIANMILFGRTTRGEGVGAELASIGRHLSDARIAVLLDLLCCCCALVLAVTLYAITRDQDPDLAMLGMTCRVGEGLLGAAGIPRTLALIWLATATGADAPDPAAAHALGAYLLRGGAALSATFFAVGSTLFAWLFLRGRMIPTCWPGWGSLLRCCWWSAFPCSSPACSRARSRRSCGCRCWPSRCRWPCGC